MQGNLRTFFQQKTLERTLEQKKLTKSQSCRRLQVSEFPTCVLCVLELINELILFIATIEQGSTYASSQEMESAEEKNNSRVRSIYLDWCRDYGKEVNEMRYPIFRSNFILMEAFAKESGKPIELNEWYDCTEEEYNSYNDRKVP